MLTGCDVAFELKGGGGAVSTFGANLTVFTPSAFASTWGSDPPKSSATTSFLNMPGAYVITTYHANATANTHTHLHNTWIHSMYNLRGVVGAVPPETVPELD